MKCDEQGAGHLAQRLWLPPYKKLASVGQKACRPGIRAATACHAVLEKHKSYRMTFQDHVSWSKALIPRGRGPKRQPTAAVGRGREALLLARTRLEHDTDLPPRTVPVIVLQNLVADKPGGAKPTAMAKSGP